MQTLYKANSELGSSKFSSLPVRAAIVGAGYIADFHALAIRKSRGVELVGVCDSNLKRAQSFAAVWGVPEVFDSVEALLEMKLNSIHLLVPPDRHHSLAKLALGYNTASRISCCERISPILVRSGPKLPPSLATS